MHGTSANGSTADHVTGNGSVKRIMGYKRVMSRVEQNVEDWHLFKTSAHTSTVSPSLVKFVNYPVSKIALQRSLVNGVNVTVVGLKIARVIEQFFKRQVMEVETVLNCLNSNLVFLNVNALNIGIQISSLRLEIGQNVCPFME